MNGMYVLVFVELVVLFFSMEIAAYLRNSFDPPVFNTWVGFVLISAGLYLCTNLVGFVVLAIASSVMLL